MFGGERAKEQDGKPKYFAVDVEAQTEINRRKEEDQQMPGRSAVMATAIDPTLREQQDDLLIDSLEESVSQKIVGAHGVEKKWKTKMEQCALMSGIDSIQEEERERTREEAVADLEYWTNQNERVSSLLAENAFKLTRGELFATLAIASSQAMQQAQEVIGFCDSVPSTEEFKRLTLARFSFNLSTASAPSTSKSRSTGKPSLFSSSEKVEQLTAAVHTAANSSQKLSAYETLDECFRESLRNWTSRENARLEHEALVKEQEKAAEELALQKIIHDKINPEEMLAAKVSRCARIGSYIFGCIDIPCFNVPAFFTGVAGVADEVGKEIIGHPLYRAAANERRAAEAAEVAKNAFENMQTEAPAFHQEAERLEQEARIHEKNEIMELAKKIVPPLTGDGDEVWNQWAEGIVEISNFNPLWAEVLARHGQQDRDWVLNQITSAWGQRIEHLEQYITQLKRKDSFEQKEKEKLAKEALKKRDVAAAVKKIVLDDQQQIKTLTQGASLARQNLVDANQELDVLGQAPIVSGRELSGEGSAKGIASMDASLGAVSQQWTKVKTLKEKHKEAEDELEKVKLHCQEQEPIAAEKEIDFNISLKRYQKYAERLDRNIERATARLEANRFAGQSILNLPGDLPFREVIVGAEGGLGASERAPALEKLPSLQQKKPHSISGDFLSSDADDEKFMQDKSNADLLEERQQVLRLGFDEKEDSDGAPFPSKAELLKRRKNSLSTTGKGNSEFDFPSISRLSEKSFGYLQRLHQSIDSEEKKEDEGSSSGGGIFRTVLSVEASVGMGLSLKMPAEAHSEEVDVGLSLTPNAEDMRRQQSLIIDARKKAARKPAAEALPDWHKAIIQASGLMTTYQQVIEVNEQALTSLDREVAAQQGSETAPQTVRRIMVTKNLEQAKEKKSDWMLKLCSYNAHQAGDLAIYQATLPTIGEVGSHHQIVQRAQEFAEAYSALKDLCIKMLREYPAVSPALQSSWMKLLDEAVRDEQHWKEKVSRGTSTPPSMQKTSKGHSPRIVERTSKDSGCLRKYPG